MTPSPDPSKRIPKSIETDTKLIGGLALTDLVVAVTPAVCVVVLTQAILPTSPVMFGVPVTVPATLVLLIAGVTVVYWTPEHAASLPWLHRILRFYRGERTVPHDEAKHVTRVERLLPASNAVERTDGAVVGAVRVEPASMALATDREWARKTDAFEDFLNTTVDFPIQLYSTTRSFPVEEHRSTYESRLADPDVEANPHLEALIENYVSWYETEHERRRTTIRDHYVIAAVSPQEIQFEHRGFLGVIADVRALGWFVRAVVEPSRIEARELMVGELDRRLDHTVRDLRGIEGLDARRLRTEDLIPLLGGFWVGSEADQGNIASRLRDTPIVAGDHH